MKPTRFEIVLQPDEAATLEDLAFQRRVSRAAVVREAIGILAAADRRGPGEYVGICSDRQAITTVLMGAR